MRICQRSPPRARTGTDSLHNNRHLIGTRLTAIDMRGQRGPQNQKRRRLRRRRMRLPPGGFENDTRGEDGGRVSTVRIRRAAPRNQKRRRSRDAAGCACPRADSKTTPAGKMAGGCRRPESAVRPPQNQKRRRSRDAAVYAGAPGRIRTVDTRFRRAVLYPLSYGGK